MQLFTGQENGIPVRASIKLLLWLFAGISTLAAVLVALLFFVDVNLYRGQIERHVSAAFGREIILAGPLSLEPSLTPRFAVKGLKITNPDWASRPFLASVDKFDIRVSLLPLLRGELQIVSLEFHGVDLLLEEATDGANNFTFSASGQPTVLPAIGHMSLYNTAIAYAAAEGPVRRLHMEQVTARKVPGQPIELEAHTTVNALPVTLSLRGEPPGSSHPQSPWQITLLGEA
ncbi:MAG: AsmA family protein, partial [Thiogranum sp.]